MRTPSSLLMLTTAWLVACGDSQSPGNNGPTTPTSLSQGMPSVAPSGTAVPASSSSVPGSPSQSGSASNAASTGSTATPGSSGPGATSVHPTATLPTPTGSAGSTTASMNTSPSPTLSAPAPSASTPLDAGGPTPCTRELLDSTTDAYFAALAAGDPASLPLADNVKFTENGEELSLGEAGLWTSAGALKYKHTALDTETCSSVSQAVVPDGATDIPVGVRITLEDGQITEIETIAVRSGDYPAVTSDPEALMASDAAVEWEALVPEGERNSRDEIVGWMNKYFRMFPSGVCNTTAACKRIENGGGSFSCSTGASCAAGEPGPNQAALNPRLILADVETGIGVGFTMFTGGYADIHMFKMYGGEVHGVSAILGTADSSGWD